MNKILWYLKQLFPLTYRSKYNMDGKKYFHVWQMWFGKCFNSEKYEIIE